MEPVDGVMCVGFGLICLAAAYFFWKRMVKALKRCRRVESKYRQALEQLEEKTDKLTQCEAEQAMAFQSWQSAEADLLRSEAELTVANGKIAAFTRFHARMKLCEMRRNQAPKRDKFHIVGAADKARLN